MRGTKFYKWIIVLLVVINIATLAFLWLGRPPHPPHPGDEPQLANEIGLTGKDKKKVDELEKQHHIDKRKLMKQDQELHMEIYDKIGSGEDIEELQGILDSNKAEIERMTFDFFDEVASFCNQEQLVFLKEHVSHRLIQMGPPPPRRD